MYCLKNATTGKEVTECCIRLRWIGPLSYTTEQTTWNERVHWGVASNKVMYDQSDAHSIRLSSFRWSSSQGSRSYSGNIAVSIHRESNGIITLKQQTEKPVHWLVTEGVLELVADWLTGLLVISLVWEGQLERKYFYFCLFNILFFGNDHEQQIL